jgi:hypothetical protein
MKQKQRQAVLLLSFTAIFTGYFSVWLPGPGAGLSFLGIEMGEWFKFLGLGTRRDLFYLPPITLSLMLIVWTMTWTGRGWRAWAVRALAVLISLLAFPAIEDITGSAREQYILRIILIGVVVLAALLSAVWSPSAKRKRLPWVLLAALGIIGALLPTWIYLMVRPFASQIMGVSIGVGLGVWLSGAGHLLVTGVSLLQISTAVRSVPAVPTRKT